jgi:pimeloyl-ACP methyl ester carboxylesterase
VRSDVPTDLSPVLTPAASRVAAGLAAVVLLLGSCGDGAEPRRSGADADQSSPTPGERQFGNLTLGSGETVSYWCAGEGSPGVLLEAGTDSGGTDAYPPAFVDPLVAETTVCAYDRLGTGASDPAPEQRRTLDHLCVVQRQVIAQLALPAPYVLVGQSGGGNLDIGCAARSPKQVAGLVTIDSYHDDPAMLEDEGFVWTDNPEHVDYVAYSEELDQLDMPIGDFPVLVVSATDADPGGEKNQRHWLGLSPQSRHVVIEGPHDLQETAPEQVSAEILKLLREG